MTDAMVMNVDFAPTLLDMASFIFFVKSNAQESTSINGNIEFITKVLACSKFPYHFYGKKRVY